MPRFFRTQPEDNSIGHLVVQEQSTDCVEVFYIPSKERLRQSGIAHVSATENRVKILKVDGSNRSLTIFPINTRSGGDFLEQKYSQIERITITESYMPFVPLTQEEVMEVLEDLPRCFVKDYDYGLGLTISYRFIVDAVEKLSECTEIVISEQNHTGIDERKNIFYISNNDLEKIRKSINRVTDTSQTAARSVNFGKTYNFFAEKIGQPKIFVQVGRSPLRRIITNLASSGEHPLSQDEQDAVLSVISRNTKSIAETKPDKLASLQRDIDLVTLDTLIERYEEMIKVKLPEERWQMFFNENPFILSMAFGYPVIKVRKHASVGGRRISGTGEKIADFLFKNSMTKNSAIVEIKTPRTKLLNARPYRSDVYTPSGDLVGAINQALEQKYQFEKGIAQIKENSGMYDIESYSVHCCLIIGTMPSDKNRLRSFELFRRNSKNVEITTYDELLKKAEATQGFFDIPGGRAGQLASVNRAVTLRSLRHQASD